MSALEVQFVALSECLVSPGHRLEMGKVSAACMHYNLFGSGKMLVGDGPPIELVPHTLIVVPANIPFRIEVAAEPGVKTPLKSVDGRTQTTMKDGVRRFIAGS